jgi:lipopolysaccharide export system protein LptA
VRWQKILRWAIAAFVAVFAMFVVMSMRRGPAAGSDASGVHKPSEQVDVYGEGQGINTSIKLGKIDYTVKSGKQYLNADGHSKLTEGVLVTVPDRNGRTTTIESQEADVFAAPGKMISTGVFKGGVKLSTSDDITVESATASYDDATQMTTIPGPLTFRKGRMTGSGTGGTYDQTRAILWILADAKVDAAPDEKGSGAIHVTSAQAGMARNDHYMRFTGGAHMDGEGHIMTSDEAMTFLTPDNERVTRMELRGNSRIAAKPGGGGPQDMRANDIDLTYAADGRTLQAAHLVENAVVKLPGETGKPGKQIAGRGIDVSLAPDGETVTNLTAAENVQVDLPPDGEIPGRRIRSTTLLATGAPPPAPGQPGGIKAATFAGGVDYREHRDAKGKVTAIDRTSKSDRLDIQTKPGFGDLERADFHNNVHFTDGPQTTAEAPTAVYDIGQDQLQLSPEPGDSGKGPHVSDGRVSIDARNIQMLLSAQKMKADTNVRSVMIQQQGKSPDDTVKVPSLMKPDQPVNVKSNRLEYDSGSSLATYIGNARLWQDPDTEIRADTIVVEDKTGNLHAITGVITSMRMTAADDTAKDTKDTKDPKGAKDPKDTKNAKDAKEQAAPAPKQEPTLTTADDMLYVDDKHRATYTGGVHMNGPDGDLTSEKLDLDFAEQGGQLERAEADGKVVSKQVNRRAFGKHLVYTTKDDIYTMTGAPAMVYDDTAPNCKVTKAPTVTYRKEAGTGSATGNGTFGQRSEVVACGSGPGTN